MGRIFLDPSTSSSYSFMTSSLLIQMIRLIRSSSRIEFFITLIAWGIFFEWWELDLQLLPYFFFSSYETRFFFFFPVSVESNYFIPWMNEFYDPGRPFKVAITTSAFFTFYFTASSCSLIWETLVKYDCMVSAFWIFTSFNWFLKVIFWCMFFPSNSLVNK